MSLSRLEIGSISIKCQEESLGWHARNVVSLGDEAARLSRGFPKVQQITCIIIHIHLYGDTGDLLHFWEALSEGLGTMII